jgi:uncharacterized coiled-coil DUF342 family protein
MKKQIPKEVLKAKEKRDEAWDKWDEARNKYYEAWDKWDEAKGKFRDLMKKHNLEWGDLE